MTSLCSWGAAYWLMAADLPSDSGSCSGVMSVIFPPFTVTFTCTFPYWFWDTAPTAVRDAAVFLGVERVLPVLDPSDELPVAAGADAAGVSFCGCAWNESTAATPATVADSTIGARPIRTRTPLRGSARAASLLGARTA